MNISTSEFITYIQSSSFTQPLEIDGRVWYNEVISDIEINDITLVKEDMDND